MNNIKITVAHKRNIQITMKKENASFMQHCKQNFTACVQINNKVYIIQNIEQQTQRLFYYFI